MTHTHEVWVVGATGLVGRETVATLLETPTITRVVAVVRRPLGLGHTKLEERVVDFDALETALTGGSVDTAVCCLGTTIKQAGSRAQFRKVDHDYVLAFARAAKAAGAKHFVVVTALGANASSFTFYNRVKGDVESALAALGFASLTIARPSLLIGDRAEARLGERLAAPLSRLLPASVRGIEGRTVARALVRLVVEGGRGPKRVVPSAELASLGA